MFLGKKPLGDETWTSPKTLQNEIFRLFFRNALSAAGNSMTSSERPSPEPLLKKEASPAVLRGENSGNALEASNALNYRAWGFPAVLSRGIPGKAPRAFPGSFWRGLFRNFLDFLPESPSRTGGVAQFGTPSKRAK